MTAELYVAVFLAGVAIVLLYSRYRGGNSGCTSHHYGEYKFKRAIDTKTEPLNPVRHRADYRVHVKQKEVATCEHDGCDATNVRWRTIEEWEGGLN